MQKTLTEIAKIVDGRVVGDGKVVIRGISGIKEAQDGDLTFLANPKYLPLARTTKASAIIVGRDVTVDGKPVVQTANPSLAFSKVVNLIKEDLTPKVKGIHPTAIVDPSADIGDGVGIGPCVVIEKGAKIGKNTIICAGAYIGQRTELGEGCLIYPNVTVLENVSVGDRVSIHPGSVIGSDGFGYVQVGDQHFKVPQMGTVVLEDDVEIGACVTIDRARFDRTVVGRGTKIDNHVQIAHNVQTGENCIIVAQVGISGSTKLGNNVTLAGQVGVVGHVTIGDRAIVGGMSGVSHNIPPGAMVSGIPAEDHKSWARHIAHFQRFHIYVEEIRELKEKVAALEKQLGMKNDK
jgi:UDP-3-O-[3-hydroxymyristoyl] glucosamine N-acyltransferase